MKIIFNISCKKRENKRNIQRKMHYQKNNKLINYDIENNFQLC